MQLTLWGFWSQTYRGNAPKLLAYGYGSNSAREAENAFRDMFPGKSVANLTLTTSYTEGQYERIAQRQRDERSK